MSDLLMTRMHELMIILYAASILFYFIDFLNHNRKVNKFAFWLLAFVWVLQTLFLLLYMKEAGRFPVLTVFEGLYFYFGFLRLVWVGNIVFWLVFFFCFLHEIWIRNTVFGVLCGRHLERPAGARPL